MKKLLWLDDIRNPFIGCGWLCDHTRKTAPEFVEWEGDGQEIVWAQSYNEFEIALQNGPFDLVCFDHDLGGGPSGYDAAKLLVEVYQQKGWPIPECRSQSGNPDNVEKILKYIENVKKHLDFSEKRV